MRVPCRWGRSQEIKHMSLLTSVSGIVYFDVVLCMGIPKRGRKYVWYRRILCWVSACLVLLAEPTAKSQHCWLLFLPAENEWFGEIFNDWGIAELQLLPLLLPVVDISRELEPPVLLELVPLFLRYMLLVVFIIRSRNVGQQIFPTKKGVSLTGSSTTDFAVSMQYRKQSPLTSRIAQPFWCLLAVKYCKKRGPGEGFRHSNFLWLIKPQDTQHDVITVLLCQVFSFICFWNYRFWFLIW